MPKSKAFKQLEKNLRKEYLGESVPVKYRKRYGSKYGKEDIKSFAYAISKSRGIKIDK